MKHLKLTLMLMFLSVGEIFAQGLSSGIDKNRMDLSINPGTDFYNYANGKWIEQNPIKPELSRLSQFDKLHEENQKRQKEIIQEVAKSNPREGSNEQKIAYLYNQFMDSLARNNAGNAPVKPYLTMVNAAIDKPVLMGVVAKLQNLGVSEIFFEAGASSDIRNAEQNLVEIYQGGLSLPSRSYYIDKDSATLSVMEGYTKYIQKLFELAGNSTNDAKKKTDAVLAIENKIAAVNHSEVQLRDVSDNYHKMSYDQFKKDFSGIDWDNYFKTSGYPKFNEISVGQIDALHNIEKLLKEESLETLKAYIEFKVLATAQPYLDDNFELAGYEFMKVLYGVEKQNPRWKKAINLVNNTMGMAIGKLYVEKYFSANSKDAVIKMVKNLQAALAEEVENSTWMSEATKAQALDKLKNFYIKIGYPDKWMDYYSMKLNPKNSLLDNIFTAWKFQIDYMIQTRVNKPVDKTEWLMTPQTVNAYYNPTTNEINFPAGILQAPFYDPSADEAANYGGIGCVIGHEMTHGFDDQGCQFDKHGNQKNWWTENDKKEFDKRAKVLKEYFDKLEVLPGAFVNGSLTLGENIADNGGIKMSYLALKNVMKTKDLGVKDGFTPEQRFFLSYAFIWAGSTREKTARVRLQTDPHSPMQMRVNGQLPHLQPWYDAFKIDKKSPMYIKPKKRVNIW
jgi:putative endopeptidase